VHVCLQIFDVWLQLKILLRECMSAYRYPMSDYNIKLWLEGCMSDLKYLSDFRYMTDSRPIRLNVWNQELGLSSKWTNLLPEVDPPDVRQCLTPDWADCPGVRHSRQIRKNPGFLMWHRIHYQYGLRSGHQWVYLWWSPWQLWGYYTIHYIILLLWLRTNALYRLHLLKLIL
jgi:hypothetical protein